MSSGNFSRRSVPAFSLEDVDKLVLYCNQKAAENGFAFSNRIPHVCPQKTINDRKKESDEMDAFSKGISVLRVIHERRVQELENIIADLHSTLSNRDYEIMTLMEQIMELGVKHRHETAQQEHFLDDTISFFKVEATRAILKIKLQMAKEALDPSFDKNSWDSNGWSRTLESLSREDKDDLYEAMVAEVFGFNDQDKARE